jgi:hypothetical protein
MQDKRGRSSTCRVASYFWRLLQEARNSGALAMWLYALLVAEHVGVELSMRCGVGWVTEVCKQNDYYTICVVTSYSCGGEDRWYQALLVFWAVDVGHRWRITIRSPQDCLCLLNISMPDQCCSPNYTYVHGQEHCPVVLTTLSAIISNECMYGLGLAWLEKTHITTSHS